MPEIHIEVGPLLDDGPDDGYNTATEFLFDAIRDVRDKLKGVTHLDYRGEPVALLVPHDWQEHVLEMPEPSHAIEQIAEAERRAHPLRTVTAPVIDLGQVTSEQPLDRIATAIALLVQHKVLPLSMLDRHPHLDDRLTESVRNWLRTGEAT